MRRGGLFQKMTALLVTLGIVLSLMIAVVGFSPITAKPVSAETATATETETVASENLSDGRFKFKDKVGVHLGAYTDKDMWLTYQIEQTNASLDGRMNALNEKSIMVFTLYREDEQGGSVPKYRIAVYNVRAFIGSKVRTLTRILYRNVNFDEGIDYSADNMIGFYPAPLQASEMDYKSTASEGEIYEVEGYGQFHTIARGYRTLDVHTNPFHFDRSGDVPILQVSFPVDSIDTSYYVEMNYATALFDSNGDVNGRITSPAKSVYGAIEHIKQEGKMETYFTDENDRAWAQQILSDQAKKTIKLEYLEEIEGGLLAEEKTTTITVPMGSGKPILDDVLTAMGKNTLSCLGAWVNGFEEDTTNSLWRVVYNSAVCLRVKAVDGGVHIYDSFLDINKSYEDYFKPTVETLGDFGKGLYQNMWNQLTKKIPYLQGKTLKEKAGVIHGYFGQMWVPNRDDFSSLNTIAAHFFNVLSKTSGLVVSYDTAFAITYTQHDKLMKAYNYNWLASTWDKILNAATGEQTTAQFYFFVAEPREYVVISQTGNTDPEDDDGAGKEVVDDTVDKVGDFFNGLFGGAQDAATTAKRLASLAVVTACVVGVMWGWGQLKGGSNGKGKKKK